MTLGQMHRLARSASVAEPPLWRAVGACRGVGEERGLEEKKRDLGRHHLWGKGSCEGIQGLGQGPTGMSTTYRQPVRNSRVIHIYVRVYKNMILLYYLLHKPHC